MQKLFDEDPSFDLISVKRWSSSYLKNNVADQIIDPGYGDKLMNQYSLQAHCYKNSSCC